MSREIMGRRKLRRLRKQAMFRMFRMIRTFRNLLKFRRMVGIYFNVMKASLRALLPL